MIRLHVQHANGEYPVHIEPGGLARLGELLRAAAPAKRCLLAVDERIATTHGHAASLSLQAAGFSPARHLVRAVESHKDLDTVNALYAAMLCAELERSSPIVAVGGGIVGDAAGFAAATFMRGVPLVLVPTTLLAMVDAAIGGKTGVNHALPEGGMGKNLIGAFWPPRAVLTDPQVLQTLEPRHLRCGLAECVKHALIADATLLEFIDRRAQDILGLSRDPLVELIARSARIKIDIVQQDERESGRRALLNLGHTFAHAVESLAELDILHGEAVSIGLVAALHCSKALQRISAADARLVVELLKRLGLPVRLAQPAPLPRLLAAMRFDKKRAAGKCVLVLPDGIGNAQIVTDVPEAIVVSALREIGAR